MEPGNAVVSSGGLSMWWTCPNLPCGTSWLIPVPPVETDTVLAEISQSSFDDWLNDRAVG
jgi:hypothetical protein